MTRQEVRYGCLWITQDKLWAKLRIEVIGEFKDAPERIVTRTRTVHSVYLVGRRKGSANCRRPHAENVSGRARFNALAVSLHSKENRN